MASRNIIEKPIATKINKANRKKRLKYGRENKAFILNFLKENPCIDCGENNPLVLEFDHLGNKKEAIANMMNRYPLATIRKEVEKCVVRCANCHRIKTAEERSIWMFKQLYPKGR